MVELVAAFGFGSVVGLEVVRTLTVIPVDAAIGLIDQSPEGLIESKDGFQPLGHKRNHETTHVSN